MSQWWCVLRLCWRTNLHCWLLRRVCLSIKIERRASLRPIWEAFYSGQNVATKSWRNTFWLFLLPGMMKNCLNYLFVASSCILYSRYIHTFLLNLSLTCTTSMSVPAGTLISGRCWRTGEISEEEGRPETRVWFSCLSSNRPHQHAWSLSPVWCVCACVCCSVPWLVH